MMKQKVSLLIMVFLLVACQNVTYPEMPENLIAKEKMAEILADAYVGNAARSINNRLLRSEGVQLDSVLYKKFNIDSIQFAESNAYYVSNLSDYTEIFDSVERLLLERKVVVDTLIAQENRAFLRRKDSLDKLGKKDTVSIAQDTINAETFEEDQELQLIESVQEQ